MYVITGATGNTGKIIAEKLLNDGKEVRILSRSEEKAKDLLAKGAELLLGSPNNIDTILKAFKGTEAAYILIPPDYSNKDFYAYQKHCADIFAKAIEKSGIKYVVALSSIGAQSEENTGVVNGLHYMEQKFNGISGLNVLYLRPAYFMENIFAQIPVIKQNGIMGSPVKPDVKFSTIASKDIGEYAAKRLSALDFKGKSSQFLLGERDVTYNEIAKIFGKAIGKPDLQYVEFPYEGLKKALLEMGASESLADNMNQMIKVINNGVINEGVVRDAKSTTPTSIEEFAKTFAHFYNM
jgi:uncharacterized protein YbjT (DUF2867 family)